MSHFIPHVEVTQTVGAVSRDTDRVFNDLFHGQVGEWPTSQTITGFHRLEIFADSDRVLGLKPTYKLIGGRTSVNPHGHTTTRPPLLIEFDDNKHLVGVFGGLDEAGTIIKIGFVVFNADPGANPPVEVKGLYGSTNLSKSSFGCYGNIIAFIGFDNNDTGLTAIGFVKSRYASPQGLGQ